MLRELDVRKALYKSHIGRILIDYPGSLVVDELGVLEGAYRIDVAVINTKFHGFEIKSASDNLDRLPAQQSTYSKIFDRMTLVADERHVAGALKIVPPWWGLVSVSFQDGKPFMNEIWPSRQNLAIDPLALCQLLWREEALELLKDLGMDYGVRTKSRKIMWRMLAKELDLDQLRSAISRKLRTRKGWRRNTIETFTA